jgi:hypothetical protein
MFRSYDHLHVEIYTSKINMLIVSEWSSMVEICSNINFNV